MFSLLMTQSNEPPNHLSRSAYVALFCFFVFVLVSVGWSVFHYEKEPLLVKEERVGVEVDAPRRSARIAKMKYIQST